MLDDKQVQEGLERVVRARIDATPAAPLVGRIVEVSVEGGHHQRLLDAVLVGLRGFLDDNRGTFRQRLEQESPWWVPEPIDDRIFKKIYAAVERFIDEVAADPDHEVRRTIDHARGGRSPSGSSTTRCCSPRARSSSTSCSSTPRCGRGWNRCG